MRKPKFKTGQVVMEKFDKNDWWKVGQISYINGVDYHFTDGRVRRARQLRVLNKKELGR